MTIEFERIDKEQQDKLITLPAGKALPIVGPD
jgi:hypothetical protein